MYVVHVTEICFKESDMRKQGWYVVSWTEIENLITFVRLTPTLALVRRRGSPLAHYHA
jgi:hypothetical protein